MAMTPQTASLLPTFAVESVNANKVSGTDFTFNISECFLYAATLSGPRIGPSLTYFIDMDGMRVASDVLPTTRELFNVLSSTHALTIAYQDSTANSSATLSSPSKFVINNATHDEQKLSRFNVSFAGIQRPQPDLAPSYILGSTDYTTALWVDNILSGTGSYMSEGGSEKQEDWLRNGIFLHYLFPRSQGDMSTQVTVTQQFSG